MRALDTALRSALTGGTALTALLAGTASVYADMLPRGGSYPAVIYSSAGGGDENDNPHRVKNVLRLVKAVSTASKASAADIDTQIDALLHNGALTVAGWTNTWLMRESDISYTETGPEGQTYYHAGGVYRIRLAQ